MGMQGLPKAAQAYIGIIIWLGALAIVVGVAKFPVPPTDWLVVIPGLLLAAGAAFINVPVLGFRSRQSNVENSSVSLGMVPTFLLLLAFGPFVGSIAGAITAIVATCYPRRSYPVQIVFSIAAVILAVFAAAPILICAGVAVAGHSFPQTIDLKGLLPIYQALATILAGIIYFLVNTFLVVLAIALAGGHNSLRAVRHLWVTNFLWMLPGYIAGATCAAILYALLPYALEYWQTGIALVVLALPVPFLIYSAAHYHREREIDNKRYIAELKKAEEELRGLYTATVESFALAIDAKDRYTQEHIQRVKNYAMDLAREMGISEEDLKAVEYGALLHDIGKIAIPENILCKPGKLTTEEFETMKSHTTIGAKILEPVRFPFPVVEVVRSHHERWDGTGYPDRLRGEEIPIGARILAVTDVYDALTSDRAYRRAWTRSETMIYLQKHMGTHFDPSVVSAFLRLLRREDEAATAAMFGTNTAGQAPADSPSSVSVSQDSATAPA